MSALRHQPTLLDCIAHPLGLLVDGGLVLLEQDIVGKQAHLGFNEDGAVIYFKHGLDSRRVFVQFSSVAGLVQHQQPGGPSNVGTRGHFGIR